MNYRLTKTVRAAVQAIDLDDVKQHLRIDWDNDDTQLSLLIDAAIEWVEVSIGRSLIATTWRLDLACWPFCPVELPNPPYVSLENVKYLDAAGTLQTLAGSQYFVSTDSYCPAVLTLLREPTLPTVKTDRTDAVQIMFKSGYGLTSAAVPANARHALLLLIAHWWENREAVVVGTTSQQLEIGLASLLRTLKTGFVAGVGV